MDILLKGMISGSLVMIILLLAQTERSQTAGLLVLFPAVTLMSYYFIGQSEGPQQLREVVRASIMATPVLLLFMAIIYFALPALDFRIALAIATGVWLLLGWLYLSFVPI